MMNERLGNRFGIYIGNGVGGGATLGAEELKVHDRMIVHVPCEEEARTT